MGEVTEKRARHYTGLDADKATIPAGGKSPGDGYYATDIKKQYYWNGASWDTAGRYEFVPRSVAAWDFTLVDFVTDNTWKVNGLDLSGIVPVGAVAVSLSLFLRDDAANSNFTIRQNAVQVQTTINLYTQVANVSLTAIGILPIDADRLLDYLGNNLAFTNIRVSVLGWFI